MARYTKSEHYEKRAKKSLSLEARGIVRGEMARQGITYAQLVEKLGAIGVQEDERNLRNKISRGKFTAAFLLQCLAALGATRIDVS